MPPAAIAQQTVLTATPAAAPVRARVFVRAWRKLRAGMHEAWLYTVDSPLSVNRQEQALRELSPHMRRDIGLD